MVRFIDEKMEIEKTINFYLEDFHPFMSCIDSYFTGTKTDWLASLTGAAGTNGKNGSSAYQLAVTNGFEESETEWLASLVGATGETGATGATGLAPQSLRSAKS